MKRRRGGGGVALGSRAGRLGQVVGQCDRGALASLVFAAAVIVLIASPILFTNENFGRDFANGIWFVSVQMHTVLHSGIFPSYFTNTVNSFGPATSYALFEPTFAFYGGPMFAAIGWLGVVLGYNATAAFEVLIIAAMSAAYGGFYWIGRMAGLARVRAHAAPLVYLTCAYYATDLYSRGDIPELVATSATVLVVASAIALVRAPKIPARTWVLLFVSAFFMTGSHNPTLVLLAFLGLPLAAFILVVWRGELAKLRRMLRVAGPVACALAVNGWYLVPDVAYASRTHIAQQPDFPAYFFDTVTNVFLPWRSVPSLSTTPGLYTQLPDAIVLWCLVVGVAACFLSRGSALLARSMVLALAAWAAMILVFLLDRHLWTELPPLMYQVQLPFRLTTYLDDAFAALTLSILVVLDHLPLGARPASRLRRVGGVTLGFALACNLALQVWQVWVPDPRFYGGVAALIPANADRSLHMNEIHMLPATWYAELDYADVSAPFVHVPPHRLLALSARGLSQSGNSFSETVNAPPGPEPILLNVVAGPYLLKISGLRRIGQQYGEVVVEREATMTGPVHVTMTLAPSPMIRDGRVLSLLGVLALIVLAAKSLRRRSRTRGRAAGD